MKKQILASVLVGALAVSSASAWSLFKNGIQPLMIIIVVDLPMEELLNGGFCQIDLKYTGSFPHIFKSIFYTLIFYQLFYLMYLYILGFYINYKKRNKTTPIIARTISLLYNGNISSGTSNTLAIPLKNNLILFVILFLSVFIIAVFYQKKKSFIIHFLWLYF